MATIQEVKQQYPFLADLDDNQVVDVMHQQFYADLPREDVASALGVKDEKTAESAKPVSRTWGEFASDSAQKFKSGVGSLLSSAGEVVDDPVAAAGAAATGIADATLTGIPRLASFIKEKVTGDGSLPLDADKGAREISDTLFGSARSKYADDLAKARKTSDQNGDLGSVLRGTGEVIKEDAQSAMSDASKQRMKVFDSKSGLDSMSYLLRNPGMISDFVLENIASQAPLLLSGIGAGGIVRSIANRESIAAAKLLGESAEIKALAKIAESGATEEAKAQAASAIKQATDSAIQQATQNVIKRTEPYIEALGITGESTLSGAQAASSIDDKVQSAKLENLQKLPEFQQYMSQYGNEADARRALAASLKAQWAPVAAMGTAGGSLLTGGALAQAKALAGQVSGYKVALKNTGKEMLEESVQNPAEDAAQYGAESAVDPNASYDPIKSAATGMLTAMGQSGSTQFARPVFNTLTGRSNQVYVPPESDDIAKIKGAASAGGVLSKIAADTVLPAADDISTEADAYAAQVRDGDLVQKLRTIAPQHVDAFLHAFAVASNTHNPNIARAEAMETIKTGVRWATTGKTDDVPGTGSPFSTDLTVTPNSAPGAELGEKTGQVPFDDRTIDEIPPGQPQLTNNPSPTLSGFFDDGNFGDPIRPNRSGPQGPSGDSTSGVGTSPSAGAGPESDEPRAPANDMGTAPGVPNGTSDSTLKEENGTQAAQTQQSQPQTPPAQALRKQVAAPKVAIPPENPAFPTTALARKRRAEIQSLVGNGFSQVEKRGNQSWLVNPARNEEHLLANGMDVNLAKQAIRAYASQQTTGAQNDNGRGTEGLQQNLGRAGSQYEENGGSGNQVRDQGLPAAGLPRNHATGDAAGNAGTRLPARRTLAQEQAILAATGVQNTTVVPHNDKRRVAIDKLLDVFEKLTGNRPIVVSSKDSDGFKAGGHTFIDVSDPAMHVAWTLAHEFKHLTDGHPGLAKLYNEIWSTIDKEDGKRQYYAYLERTTASVRGSTYDTATPEQLALLKDEMVADFLGKRLTDGVWLKQIARQKPHLFGEFIKEWIPLLSKIIAKLKGYKSGDSNIKDVDQYISDLERAKSVAEQALEMWATERPGFANQAGFGDVRNSVKLRQWAKDFEDNKRVDGVMQVARPSIPLRMAGLTAGDQIIANKNFLTHLIRRGRSVSSDIVGKIPLLLATPRAVLVTYEGQNKETSFSPIDGWTKRYNVVSSESDANGNPYMIAMQKENNFISVVDLKTMFGQTNSLAYLLRAIRDGGFVWMPKKEVDRIKAITGKASIASTGQTSPAPKSLEATSNRMQLDQRSTGGIVLSDDASVKFMSGGDWRSTGESIPVTDMDVRLARNVHFSTKEQTLEDDFKAQEAWLQDKAVENGYSDIEQMFVSNAKLFNQLATEWREHNPAEVLNSNKDLQAELQAELEDEQNGVVSDERIKSYGVHAEDAYADPEWKRRSGGLLRAEVPDLYFQGSSSALQLEPEGNGLWGATMRGTWIGPADMETTGYATLDMAKKFVKRFIASKDLFRRGYDLLTATDKADKLVGAWKDLSAKDGSTRYQRGDVAGLPMKALAHKLGITRKYDVNVITEKIDNNSFAYVLEFTDKATGADQSAMLEVNKVDGKKVAIAHTASLTKGGLGAGVYQMFAEFAASKGIQIHPDDSLSGINTYRRTEQMLSAAFRTGKSDVMIPHEVQRVYGFNPNASTEQEHNDNIARLLLAGLRNAQELMPQLDKLTYTPETGAFTYNGKDAEHIVKKMLMDNDARAFGLGRSTLARAVMTKDILAGNEVKAESFKEPVLYSMRAVENDENDGIRYNTKLDPMGKAASTEGERAVTTVSSKPGRSFTVDGKSIKIVSYPKTKDVEFATTRLHARVRQIIGGSAFTKYVQDFVALGSKVSIGDIRGLWAGEREDTFTLRVSDDNGDPIDFATARRLTNLMGFGFVQEGAVTAAPSLTPISGVDPTPAVLIGKPNGAKMDRSEINDALAAARDVGFFGASEAMSGKGVKFLFFPDKGSPKSVDEQEADFVAQVQEVQKRTGLTGWAKYKNVSSLDEARKYWRNANGIDLGSETGSSGLQASSGQPLDLFRGSVDTLLAPYIAALRVEGFDVNYKNWQRVNGATDAQRQYLESKVAELEDINKHGVVKKLRQQVSIVNQKQISSAPVITQTTTNANAVKQLAALDDLLSKAKDPTASVDNWLLMNAQAYGTNDVPMAPSRFIKMLHNDGIYTQLKSLTPGQVQDADHGFANAAEFRRLYESGAVKPATTAKLMLWSFLSRGVSPYVQEGGFIDLVGHVEPFAQKLLDGKFSDDDVAAWNAVVSKTIVKGTGQPGAGTTHNANAFGSSFMRNMATRMPDGRTRMAYMHDLFSDPKKTGREIRREFVKIGEGAGIDNKVISFTLLVIGHTDVAVLDRVQIDNTFNDGRLGKYNLYDGVTRYGYRTKGEFRVEWLGTDKAAKEEAEDRVEASGKKGEIVATLQPGSGMAGLTTGVQGLLIYEPLENALEKVLPDIYARLVKEGLRSPDMAQSVGRWHWESWVAHSGQEASHQTLDALLNEVRGDVHPFADVPAKEGEYGSFAFGTEYALDRNGDRYKTYSTSSGEVYKMSLPDYQKFIAAVKKKGKSGVVPTGFKVSANADKTDRTEPWFNDPRVNIDKLDALVREYGTPYEINIKNSARDTTRPSTRIGASDSTTVRQAIHYGNIQGLTTLSGRSFGTGVKGAEQERLSAATDPRIKQRVYFYAPVQGGIPQPEVGLGGNVYQADLDNIYDPRVANTPLRGSGNALESAVLDAGYDGYTDPESGVVVMLGRDVPVKHIGAIGDFKIIQRQAERVVPKVATRQEGDELVRKAQGNEMAELAHPAKRAKIVEAAPSFKMQYGEFRVKSDEAQAADSAIAEFSQTFRFSDTLFSKRDDAELIAEQETQDAAVEAKSESKYAGKKVTIPVKIEDTGEIASLIMDVDTTANDYVSRLQTLEELAACL